MLDFNTMIDGKRKKIHLYHQPRKTKEEGVVNYYSLAVCSKENGKNMKKVLQYLGRLSTTEAENYRMLLKALNDNRPATQLVDIHDIVVTEEKKYFPQLGDAPAVIKQKRDSRELAIKAMNIQSGNNIPNLGAPPANAPPVGAPPTAKQAPDGKWYAPDPARPGKYLQY